MLRFFLGLTLAQLIIAALVQFSPLSNSLEKALLSVFVILLLSTIITLWFGTVAKHMADNRIAALKEQFASEREKLNVNAEREQKKLLKKTQKEILFKRDCAPKLALAMLMNIVQLLIPICFVVEKDSVSRLQ